MDGLERKAVRGTRRAFCGWAALSLALPARAQGEWPERPVRIVVGFPAGGTNDVVARLLAQRLSDRIGKPFVVENRPGAGGNVGTNLVAKAPADGYTLLMASNGALATNRFLYKAIPFDADKDFTPIVMVGETPILIAVNPKVAAADLRALVQMAKAQPGRLNFGTPGNGTIGHLTLVMLQSAAGISLQHVPYGGGAPALKDALAGSVDGLITPSAGNEAQVLSGGLRGLAVTTRRRSPNLPGVPTAVEQGLDLEAASILGLYGPAGLPSAIVQKINAEVNQFVASPEGKTRLVDAGVIPAGGTPEHMGQVMAAEVPKWKRVVDAAGGVRLD